MTYYDFGLIPDEADLVSVQGRMSPTGVASAFAVGRHVTVLFGSQPEDREFAIRYLTKLGNEALKLAHEIAEAKS